MTETTQTLNLNELKKTLDQECSLFETILDRCVQRDVRGMDLDRGGDQDSVAAVCDGDKLIRRIQMRSLYEIALKYPERAPILLARMSHLKGMAQQFLVPTAGQSAPDDSDEGLLKQAEQAGDNAGA